MQPFEWTLTFIAIGQLYICYATVWRWKALVRFLQAIFKGMAHRYAGSAAYYYLLREQNKAEPEILESTTAYHFLAFFVSG